MWVSVVDERALLARRSRLGDLDRVVLRDKLSIVHANMTAKSAVINSTDGKLSDFLVTGIPYIGYIEPFRIESPGAVWGPSNGDACAGHKVTKTASGVDWRIETDVEEKSGLPIAIRSYDENGVVAQRQEWIYEDVHVLNEANEGVFDLDLSEFRIYWSHYIYDADNLRLVDFPFYYVGNEVESSPFFAVINSKDLDSQHGAPSSIVSVVVAYRDSEGERILSLTQRRMGESGCGEGWRAGYGGGTRAQVQREDVCISVSGETSEIVQMALRELREFQ